MFNKKSNSIISSILQLLIITLVISTFVTCDEDDNNGYTGPWVEVPTPGGPDSRLNACYFTSSDNGWACGNSYNFEEERSYPLLIHWNGVEWEEYPYGGWFDGEEFINIKITDISFSGPSNGWAVGNLAVNHSENFGFILRYDGNQWYIFKSHFEWRVDHVYCISEDDVWFVVYEKYSGDSLYHWDGDEYERYYVGTDIRDIAFSSSTEGLAVGLYYSVYHWDGMKWEQIWKDTSRPEPHNAVSYYEPNKAWIVGSQRMGKWINGEYTYWYEWDYDYEDIHFSHSDEGWMIGCGPDPSDPLGYGGYIWHWNGNNWERMEKPPDMGANAVFSVDYYDAWIVGWGKNNECWSWNYEP
ncbi:MAG: hypothetical protein DRH51_04630 [Candidatus Coatesbacteria bacterium]|nr:MAG: hypothetical protein DRH51_04630 [Candidatus Coatesbacteria bacterium]